MLPDQNSIDELKSVLNNQYKNNKFKYKKIRKEMKRFKLKKTETLSNISSKRDYTFITHGTENEFFKF